MLQSQNLETHSCNPPESCRIDRLYFLIFSDVQEVTENLQKCKGEQKKPSISSEKRMCDFEKMYLFKTHNYDNAELRGNQLQDQKK
jgi:hypothetical protein